MVIVIFALIHVSDYVKQGQHLQYHTLCGIQTVRQRENDYHQSIHLFLQLIVGVTVIPFLIYRYNEPVGSDFSKNNQHQSRCGIYWLHAQYVYQ